MKKINFVFLFVILFATEVSLAQYGTLDAAFDGDGKVLTTFGEFDSSVSSLAIQPDGKIIVAGHVYNHKTSYSQFALTRYNSDGSLDNTFGFKGKAVVMFPKFQMFLHSIVLHPDGKITAVGIAHGIENKSLQTVLVRCNSDGTVDTTFGEEGIVARDLVFSTSLALQSDGKIIIAGYILNELFKPDNRDFVLIRYNGDGTSDASFGIKGVMATSMKELGYNFSVTLQSNGKSEGKIVVASDSSGNNSDFVIAQYHPNGTVDTDFGVKGIVKVGTRNIDVAASVKIQLDGKIVIAGTSLSPGSFSSGMLVRLLDNGALDPDFGKDGLGISNVWTSQKVESLEIQADGKIVVAGTYLNTEGYDDIILTRYETNGDLDPTFGKEGTVVTAFGTRSQAHSLALQLNGEIVVGGFSGNPEKVDFAVLRYNSGLELSETELNPQKTTFLVYPNPINQTVNLDFNLNRAQEITIDLYDMNGIKIKNLLNEMDFKKGYNSQKIELPENLSKGIYFLNISEGNSTSYIKIVK